MEELSDEELLKKLEAQLIEDNKKLELALKRSDEVLASSKENTEDEDEENDSTIDKSSKLIEDDQKVDPALKRSDEAPALSEDNAEDDEENDQTRDKSSKLDFILLIVPGD